MTIPRPSFVTSSGPSPVRGFIAAMPHPLSPAAAFACACCYSTLPLALASGRDSRGLWCQAVPRMAPSAHAAVSHNRVDPTPYYPVSERRMVMNGYARRQIPRPITGSGRRRALQSLPASGLPPRPICQRTSAHSSRLLPAVVAATNIASVRNITFQPIGRVGHPAGHCIAIVIPRMAGLDPARTSHTGGRANSGDYPVVPARVGVGHFLQIRRIMLHNNVGAGLSVRIAANARGRVGARGAGSAAAGRGALGAGIRKAPGARCGPTVPDLESGDAGNRTRVLQYITRTSPSAACCVFLSPGNHAGKLPTGSATVCCPSLSRGRAG
jgi:hypothetical protein